MSYGVDTEGVRPAAAELAGRSELARSQLGACARLLDGLVDPRLKGGVGALADVAGDVLELVAADLALLATKVRAGAMLYDRVEGAVGRGMSR